VKSLTVLRIVTAPTAIEAQRKYDQLQSNYHLQAQLSATPATPASTSTATPTTNP